MVSLGRKLRTAREQQGLSLADIATRTRIRLSYLEAIEQDRLDQIPGGFSSRSFVRQYAQALGLTSADIDGDLEAVTVPPVETVPVEKVLRDYRPTKPTLLVEEDGSEFFHEAAFVKESNSGRIWMALAITLIFGSAGYLTWQQRPDLRAFVLGKTIGAPPVANAPVAPVVPVPVEPAPTVPADGNPAVPYAEVNQEAAPGSVPPAPQASNLKPESATPLASPPPLSTPQNLRTESLKPTAPPTSSPQRTASTGQTSPIEVAVSATEKSWVRLLSDGEKIFGGVMEAGETRRIAGSMSAVVFTGNAGGLVIQYNGRPLGAPGPRGQIRTVVFTPQNFEIRSSQPQPASPSSPGAAGAAVREP
jgi:cytoskeleton protein RodZ